MSAGVALRVPLVLVGALLLLRLATLGFPPLFDTTEGRYAEIGREMAVSGDWVTPTLHGGEPFWGKPPLHFWGTALSIRLFGPDEWAARLPSFLAALGILLIVWRVGREAVGGEAAKGAVVLLAGSALFFLLSGAVLLDVTFTFAVTGASGAFLLFARDRNRRWTGLAFYLFLALGLLAKGPVVLPLVFLPILLRSVIRKSAADLLALPWLPGVAIVLLVAAPWFLLAERKTPGFANYFFIHEHVLRFLRKEYGDLYGHGHVSPYGLVWLLGFASFLPWSPAVIALALRHRRNRSSAIGEKGGADLAYLWLWSLSPFLIFTLSRSLSLPYVFPALPPLAILLGRGLARGEWKGPRGSLLFSGLVLIAGVLYARFTLPLTDGETAALITAPMLLTAAGLVLLRREGTGGLIAGTLLFPAIILSISIFTPGALERGNSTRHLAEAIEREGRGERTTATSNETVFWDGMPLSAEFYFRGEAIDLKGDADMLRSIAAADDAGDRFLIARRGRLEKEEWFDSLLLDRRLDTAKHTIWRIGEETQ